MRVQIIDNGVYVGSQLISVKRAVSWLRRGILRAQPGREPLVVLS